MPALIQARRYVGYFQVAYWALVVAMALLIMGIILLDRRVRGATRWLGIPCLISGIVTYVGTFVIGHFVGGLMAQIDLPAPLGNWQAQLVSEALAPIRVHGIVLMAVGVALLIVSFVNKRRHYDYLPE
jgi:cell division protein FtsW (lipid II flippase)